ncbi:MAG: NAD(P)H-hydrate dehydratase [Verrucomicrobia bacterium]|nr:NAD(P)H-hydrate dehydratase [Verrucomicrobiota bacterium]
MPPSHPILSCEASRAWEHAIFQGDEAKEWPAMLRAGRALAQAIRRDAEEIGGLPDAGRILVLAGKGHNGGDALLAARELCAGRPDARVEVVFAFGERSLRPLAARAWRDLVHGARAQVAKVPAPTGAYDLCLDGVFGFPFRPPAPSHVVALLQRVNAAPIRFRAAVDLPSAGVFRADFTYATGILKEPVVGAPAAGRVCYLDLGFFPAGAGGDARVLLPETLDPLRGWREPTTDKRSHGHAFVLGGSGAYPGAVLLTVLSALRSGAGLVTAFVPEALVAAFAARAPEAIWVGWPQTPAGGLALEGEHLLRARIDRATALLIGPGLGREPETLALAASVAGWSPVPMVIDADGLQREVVCVGRAPRVLTPHAGELERIGGRQVLRAGITLVEKGPVTRICHGPTVLHSFFGGPVLARGGSGDVLAGLIGGLLAQAPADPLGAAARGVVWHGLAADFLAREKGPAATCISELVERLAPALREGSARPCAGGS